MSESEEIKVQLPRQSTFNERDTAEPPRDRFNIGPIMSTFFGVCALLPWNSFINNIPWFLETLKTRDDLTKIFSSTLSVSSQIPLILTFLINTMFLYKMNRQLRMYISYGIMIIGFAVIMVLAGISSTGKETLFFAVIMIDAAVLSACSSVCQASMFAHLAYFPPIYFVGYLFGQALAGVIVSVIAILVAAGNYSLSKIAFIYFGSTLGTVVLCLVIFVLFTKSPQYRYYMRPEVTDKKENVNKQKLSSLETLKAYKDIFMKIPNEALTILLIFSVTLMYFPGLTLGVKSLDTGEWGNKYFVLVYVFLTFNVGDAIGRYSPRYIPYPNGHSIWLTLLSLLRFLFLPLFLICNKYQNTYVPSLIKHDSVPIILMLLFAISNGHLSTIAFGSAVQNVSVEEMEMCNTLTVFLLGLGLTIGAFLSFGFNILVT